MVTKPRLTAARVLAVFLTLPVAAAANKHGSRKHSVSRAIATTTRRLRGIARAAQGGESPPE